MVAPRAYVQQPVYAATTYMFAKSAIAANPKLPEQIVKAHAEAIKRFYDDKAFAVKTYIAFDKQPGALRPTYVLAGDQAAFRRQRNVAKLLIANGANVDDVSLSQTAAPSCGRRWGRRTSPKR